MKFFIITLLTFMTIYIKKATSDVLPNDLFSSIEVVELQMSSLQTNTKNNNSGIYQCWLFAHPENKKSTGPYARFRIMIYGDQYRTLLNHTSHKIELLMNSPNKYIFKIKILSKDKQLLFYEWHVEKASENNCKDCWFTSAVSMPIDQGNTI